MIKKIYSRINKGFFSLRLAVRDVPAVQDRYYTKTETMDFHLICGSMGKLTQHKKQKQSIFQSFYLPESIPTCADFL